MKLSTKGRYAMIALTDLAAAGAGPAGLPERDRRAAGHQPRLPRAAVRQAPPRRHRRVGARAGRRLPAGAAGRADPHLRDPRRRRRDDGRARPRRRRQRRHRRHREQGLADKLWERLSANVYVMLHQTRLADVVNNQLAPCPAVPAFVAVVDDAAVAAGGGVSGRVYLDWNASAPLRPEARAAMAAALDAARQPLVGARRGPRRAGDRRAGARAGRGGDRLPRRRGGLHLRARPRRRRWRSPGAG